MHHEVVRFPPQGQLSLNSTGPTRTPTPTRTRGSRAEVGEEVRVGVGVGARVGPVEFKLYATNLLRQTREKKSTPVILKIGYR